MYLGITEPIQKENNITLKVYYIGVQLFILVITRLGKSFDNLHSQLKCKIMK